MPDYNKKIKELTKMFENFDQVTPDKMESLVNESIKTFESIIANLDSPDEEERNKAMKAAEELRVALEDQAKNALKKAGMDEETVNKYINSSENFLENEWKAIEHAKDEIEDYQKELTDKGLIEEKPKASPKKATPKKNKKPKTWI